ncbi:MAG TPA: 50S ribosomal protein L21 [Candidatus Onthoplasma faecigallinarum]|nr:50S ribosomal protein L21 [Candidatus Onthoplasma faecigallinarum]
MYAIVNISGRQYKVEAGQTITVDRLNAEIGEELSFPVLMTVDGSKVKTGSPVIKDVVAKVKVLSHVQDKKITVFKYKAKKNERKKQGHRQPYTKITVESIG